MAPGRTPALQPTNGPVLLVPVCIYLVFDGVSIYLGSAFLPIYPVDHTPMHGKPVREALVAPQKSKSGCSLRLVMGLAPKQKNTGSPGVFREQHMAPGQEGLAGYLSKSVN